MKNMQIYHNKRNRNKSTKIIDNKNIKSNVNSVSSITGYNKKSNYTSFKKEINSKNNEESNFSNNRKSHHFSQKSIDNLLQNNKMLTLTNSINNNNKNLANSINKKKLTNTKFNQTNIYIPKNIPKKKNIKRHSSIERNKLNNNFNDKQSKKKSLPNISTPYIQTDKSYSKEFYLDSNGSIYENELNIIDKKNIVTTLVQIEDLTKIPDRIGSIQNKYADYDYNEAKRAAVTCRRIEYSYNLRNVIKSEICLDEIIIIQRWWRDILRKKNEELSKELKILNKININNIQKYIDFLNKIHYIYAMHLLSEFINKLKIGYGKLYYKNYFSKFALRIQKVFRTYISNINNSRKLKLANLLNKVVYNRKKSHLIDELKKVSNVINKIKFLQNFIKYNILRKNEKYRLKCAHEIHPFIYFLLKFKIPLNPKSIRKYKQKRARFMIFVQKWINFHKYKRLIKCMMFIENIKFIIKKKFFIYFILRLVERINAMITYFLLQPLMKNILRIYYLRKIHINFMIWKKNDAKLKHKNNLAWNLISKIIKAYTLDDLIKNIKNRKK